MIHIIFFSWDFIEMGYILPGLADDPHIGDSTQNRNCRRLSPVTDMMYRIYSILLLSPVD